jgi:hypothetical protein
MDRLYAAVGTSRWQVNTAGCVVWQTLANETALEKQWIVFRYRCATRSKLHVGTSSVPARKCLTVSVPLRGVSIRRNIRC